MKKKIRTQVWNERRNGKEKPPLICSTYLGSNGLLFPDLFRRSDPSSPSIHLSYLSIERNAGAGAGVSRPQDETGINSLLSSLGVENYSREETVDPAICGSPTGKHQQSSMRRNRIADEVCPWPAVELMSTAGKRKVTAPVS